MLYVASTVNLQMLEYLDMDGELLSVQPIMGGAAASQLLKENEWVSAVGHVGTAQIYSTELGVTIPVNRMTVKLQPGDAVLVGQLIGGRLRSGATRLPERIHIRWVLVKRATIV